MPYVSPLFERSPRFSSRQRAHLMNTDEGALTILGPDDLASAFVCGLTTRDGWPASVATPTKIVQGGLRIEGLTPAHWEAIQNQSIPEGLRVYSTMRPLQAPTWAFFDMDGTLVLEECLDTLGDYLGVRAEIAEITQAAMRGTMDFLPSLMARLELLKGLTKEDLIEVGNRLTLRPGFRELIAELKSHGTHVVMISGGLMPMCEAVGQRLGIETVYANTPVFDNEGKMTGELTGDLVTGEGKANIVKTSLEKEPGSSWAFGDGANDVGMFKLVDLAIGVFPKPVLEPYADVLLTGTATGDDVVAFLK